jgi:E3 ubiquitin-protein ligase HUWE1
VFATAEYAHGRSAIGLLQSLMNNMSPQVIADLGSLHRVSIWENIVLNLGLKSKGILLKRSSLPSTSTLGGRNVGQSSVNLPENDGSVNPSELNSDLNSPDGAEPMASSPTVPLRLGGPLEKNSAALKHLTNGLPASLSPFFQGNWTFLLLERVS